MNYQEFVSNYLTAKKRASDVSYKLWILDKVKFPRGEFFESFRISSVDNETVVVYSYTDDPMWNETDEYRMTFPVRYLDMEIEDIKKELNIV